jgi:hypothetical protein
MMRRPLAYVLPAIAAVIALGGCGGSGSRDTAETAAEAPAGASVEARAASIADAIEARPTAADSILAANGMDLESFEALMFEIAADEQRTAAFQAARR